MLSFSRPVAFFSLRKDQAFWCFRALGFMFTVAWRVREDWLRHSGELSVTFLCLFFPHPITRKPQANFGHWDVSLPEIQSSGTFSPRREALMKLLRGNVQPREALFWKTRGS